MCSKEVLFNRQLSDLVDMQFDSILIGCKRFNRLLAHLCVHAWDVMAIVQGVVTYR